MSNIENIHIYINVVIPEATDHYGKTGGVVRMIEIFKRFEKISIAVNLIMSTTASTARYFQKNGLEADYRIVNSSFKYRNKFDLSLKSLYLLVKSFFVLPLPTSINKKDRIIIYASSDLFWETIPAFVYKLKNKNIEWIQVIHHIYPDWKKRAGNKLVSLFGSYLQKVSFFLIKKKADKIIVLNNSIKNELIKKGFEERRLYLGYNGINLDYLDSIERKDFSYDGVFLGRLSPSKGTNDLIEIWKKVCESLPEARLAIIGGGNNEEKKQLGQKIEKYHLENNIDLLGFLENDETFSILKSGKVFLAPSHEEGWGIAISEAMACGLPVVAWNLPAYEEIYGDNIIKIGENNVDLFAKKILQLLNNKEKREGIGKRGREFVKKYSWENVAKREYEIILDN
jgi:glycosyltransferase involved in cell wall biosynthesis